MDPFDSDALIDAADPRIATAPATRARIEAGAGVGSVLLLPEVVAKPIRAGSEDERPALGVLLARVDLRPADATHLATAIRAGADRLTTGNRKDFGRVDGLDLEVVHPEQP